MVTGGLLFSISNITVFTCLPSTFTEVVQGTLLGSISVITCSPIGRLLGFSRLQNMKHAYVTATTSEWFRMSYTDNGSIPLFQAEEELVKAQKVFEEMNIDLQEELPSLWNR